MSIAKGLNHLGFTSLVDFVLRDDNGTTVFEEWNSDKPQPTMEEIQAASNAWQAEYDDAATANTTNTASAKTKLKALGLTDDELRDAFGL